MPILANAGLPMIFVEWPLMICALLPIILLETALIRRWVSLSVSEAFVGIGKANVYSTLVGVPLAWLTALAVEFAVLLPYSWAANTWKWELQSPVWEVLGFILMAAWIGPVDRYAHWAIPGAVALLLIPCFFISLRLEYQSCAKTWATANPERVRQGIFAVNVASYSLLFVLACSFVAYQLVTKGPEVIRSRVERITGTNSR
jgi:hypothetical protein